MDRAAVAVLILSQGYFSRKPGGGEYILEKELPVLVEHYRAGELDLLPVYWSPSNHFAPGRTVKPFEYEWQGSARSFDMHGIQALTKDGCLEDASKADRRDALLELAHEAERRLEAQRPLASTQQAQVQGRQALTIQLAAEGSGVRRTYRAGGRIIPLASPHIPRAELDGLRPEAFRSLPDQDARTRVGRALYRLLFEGRGGEDLFPRLAEDAWGRPPDSLAHTLAVALELRCGPLPCEPWPLSLPWHLTRAGKEPLIDYGWSFEAVPPGIDPRFAPILGPEPQVQLYIDDRLPGAASHANQLAHLLERHLGFAPDLASCSDLDRLAEVARGTPELGLLYAYAPAGLDLTELAAALGESAPLVLLNLIGEPVPEPPAALVRNRKLVLSLFAFNEAHLARAGGAKWLQALLDDAAGLGPQRIALESLGDRVRLWSGAAGLEGRIAAVQDAPFHRQLIKLFLDRVSARREVSDEMSAALSQGIGTLGLIAAGTAQDHPSLLPKQARQHYRHFRPADSRDDIRPLDLNTGPNPYAEELLVHFATALGRGRDDWQDELDRMADTLESGDHLILSLEWRLSPCPGDWTPDAWRKECLTAWLDLGARYLADYRRTGVLLLNWLILETGDAGEARRWTEEAESLWDARGRTLPPAAGGFAPLWLEPLSVVPVKDIKYFLERHYHLQDRYPDLDPTRLAHWIVDQTAGGVFAEAVRLVEALHDDGFQAARDALPPRST